MGQMDIGAEVISGVFVERVGEGRWMIRSNLRGQRAPDRVGEVFGGNGKYVAYTMSGDRVVTAKTLRLAAVHLSQTQ